MRADLVAAPVSTEVGSRLGPAPRAALGGLTRRASLNAAASLLDYSVKIGVGLLVTPVLLSGLGRSLFGVWEMLGRLVGYMSATDGRPTEALRLVVAQHQSDSDDERKRRYVGAALAVWVLVLPLVAAAGAVLVWLAPRLTQVAPQHHTEVRLAAGLLIANFLLSTLASVPESALRGMNLGYKRMGLQAGLNVLGGALAAGAVLAGFGLSGLAGAQVLRAGVTGLCFLLLVRAYVAWYGVVRPHMPEIKALFGMSIWLSVGDLVAKVLLASDVVILGAVVAPALVTTYVLTGYAARIAAGMHVFAAGAATPGLGGLLGRRELDRAARARRELLTLTWLFVTAVGTTILVWNRSFLDLWVGAENYAGGAVNLLIVLIAAQTAFIRVEAYMIDAALRPKQRVLVGAVAAALMIAVTIPLTHALGVWGLCAGVLAGRAVQSLAYPRLVRGALGESRSAAAPRQAWRLILVTAALFGAGWALGDRLTAATWLNWVAGVPLTLGLAAGLALALGLEADGRRAIVERARALLAGDDRG